MSQRMNTGLRETLEKPSLVDEWSYRLVGVESMKTAGQTLAINRKCGPRPESGRKLRHLDFILVVMKR